MKKTFAVIGIGSFGSSCITELTRLGVDVLAIDNNKEIVDKISNLVSHATIFDSTDEKNLKDIGIQYIDHVIVSIGNVQASILTTLILKDLGVKKITVKAENDYHARVVETIGADEVILPDKSAGRRLARRIISDNVIDYYDVSKDYSIFSLKVQPSLTGHTLKSLDTTNKHNINIVLVKRGEESLFPKANLMLKDQDEILVVGTTKDIKKFDEKVNK